jgi:hypothetical protein
MMELGIATDTVICHRVQGLMDTIRLLVLCYADGAVSQLYQLDSGQLVKRHDQGECRVHHCCQSLLLCRASSPHQCCHVGPLTDNPGAPLCHPSLAVTEQVACQAIAIVSAYW